MSNSKSIFSFYFCFFSKSYSCFSMKTQLKAAFVASIFWFLFSKFLKPTQNVECHMLWLKWALHTFRFVSIELKTFFCCKQMQFLYFFLVFCFNFCLGLKYFCQGFSSAATFARDCVCIF